MILPILGRLDPSSKPSPPRRGICCNWVTKSSRSKPLPFLSFLAAFSALSFVELVVRPAIRLSSHPCRGCAGDTHQVSRAPAHGLLVPLFLGISDLGLSGVYIFFLLDIYGAAHPGIPPVRPSRSESTPSQRGKASLKAWAGCCSVLTRFYAPTTNRVSAGASRAADALTISNHVGVFSIADTTAVR